MLGFFRRHQKYFFVVITFVIVVSFSFFGTYSTLNKHPYHDKVAFTAIDGREIKRYELDQMAVFLGTDNEDKLLFGGAWGPNFLNDGVIKKDLLQTGMAQILVQNYLDDLRADLESRFQKEKKFTPYMHPQAKFLSAENAWNLTAPQINTYLKDFRKLDDPTSSEAFDLKVKLFQAQRQFPQPALRHILRLQMKQYNWIAADPQFDRTDLSLFGYHTVADWFGQAFLRLSSEFIINSALIAQEKGYHVSKQEALADLFRNAEISYQQNINNPNLGVKSPQEYFDEQLRRMGMDEAMAVDIWEKVMLFRRLFQDLGNSVFIDPFTVQQFESYAKQSVGGDLYSLPDALQIGDFNTLQKFEVYLNAVADRKSNGKDVLSLPKTYLSTEKVAEKYPELVQRRFLLEYAQVDKRMLQANVGVKETWDWEIQERNWEKLKKEFPELGTKSGSTEQERIQTLDSLDKKTRSKVDIFSRTEIVNANPDRIRRAVEEAPKVKREVAIFKKGDNPTFPGLKKPQELIDLLDRYPETKDALEFYTPDGNLFYHISVIERAPKPEVLTFAQANASGILDGLASAYLEKQYAAIREKHPADFKTQEGAWKPFAQARQEVAKKAFGPILEAIKTYQADKADSKEMIPDYAASYRLAPYMDSLRISFMKDSSAIAGFLAPEQPSAQENTLSPHTALEDQWKVAKTPYRADRGTNQPMVDIDDALKLPAGDWSSVFVRTNGDIGFIQIQESEASKSPLDLYEKVFQIQHTIAEEAQRGLMRRLVEDMDQKGALSLDFLKQVEEEQPL